MNIIDHQFESDPRTTELDSKAVHALLCDLKDILQYTAEQCKAGSRSQEVNMLRFVALVIATDEFAERHELERTGEVTESTDDES